MAPQQHWNKTECIFDKLDSPPTILFVELESWESDELASLCPSKCKVITSSDRLESLSDKEIPSEISIFSPFIHSRVDATQLGRMPAALSSKLQVRRMTSANRWLWWVRSCCWIISARRICLRAGMSMG